MNNKMTPGKRIKELRKYRGLSQTELAERCGWEGAGRLSNYENESRQPKPGDITLIADALNADPNWLLFGRGENPMLVDTDMGKIRKSIPEGKAPIIEWNEIIDWNLGEADIFLNKNWKYIDSPNPKNKKIFALIIKGESMIGSPKSFNPGSLIFIDPEAEAINTDYILVKKPNVKEPILRQLLIEGGKYYLKPLNSDYKIEEKKDYIFCGVVIDHRDPRKY
jgi:transcriptional regulator with XRE-family HTH domain